MTNGTEHCESAPFIQPPPATVVSQIRGYVEPFLNAIGAEHVTELLGGHPWATKLGGMSGSLVWNTRYREVTEKGAQWTPADLRVTGLVWAHTSKAGGFVATPVQHLLEFLRAL